MTSRDEIFEAIDRLARQEPDPARSAARIKVRVESVLGGGVPWSSILERFSATRAPTIGIAIAWCLAEDAAQSSPKTSLGDLLDLGASFDWRHPNLAHMVLVGIENRARHHPGDPGFEASAVALRRLLLDSGDYDGEGEVLVRVSWLATLEALRDAFLWDRVLDPSTRQAVRSLLRRLADGMDGPFREQVDGLLGALEGPPTSGTAEVQPEAPDSD